MATRASSKHGLSLSRSTDPFSTPETHKGRQAGAESLLHILLSVPTFVSLLLRHSSNGPSWRLGCLTQPSCSHRRIHAHESVVLVGMIAVDAVLSRTDPPCPCGSSSHERIDDSIVCVECGRVLDDECFVNYGHSRSEGVPTTDNIVPEGCTGAHLTGAKRSVSYWKQEKVKRLQAQASSHGRVLELSEPAISSALGLIKDHTRGIAASEPSAVAAALVLGSRIEGFPVVMKDVCLRLDIPFSDFRRSLASLKRQMDGPAPPVQVDEVLKCSSCKFCAARELSPQLRTQLQALGLRLLQFTRRHIRSSVTTMDAAVCAVLAIELIAEVSPNSGVLDDLGIGVSLEWLKSTYYQHIYDAIHAISVEHGVVATTGGPVQCWRSDRLRDRRAGCGPAFSHAPMTTKRKRKERSTPCDSRELSRPNGSSVATVPGVTLQQVRTMLDIDECMAL